MYIFVLLYSIQYPTVVILRNTHTNTHSARGTPVSLFYSTIVLYFITIVGSTVVYSSITVHIVYGFVVRYIPGTVVKYSGVYWSTPGSTSYEYSTPVILYNVQSGMLN